MSLGQLAIPSTQINNSSRFCAIPTKQFLKRLETLSLKENKKLSVKELGLIMFDAG